MLFGLTVQEEWLIISVVLVLPFIFIILLSAIESSCGTWMMMQDITHQYELALAGTCAACRLWWVNWRIGIVLFSCYFKPLISTIWVHFSCPLLHKFQIRCRPNVISPNYVCILKQKSWKATINWSFFKWPWFGYLRALFLANFSPNTFQIDLFESAPPVVPADHGGFYICRQQPLLLILYNKRMTLEKFKECCYTFKSINNIC